MANNTIRSKYEEMDVVYRDFSAEIEKFSMDMYSKSGMILSTVNNIGEHWKGNGYADFKTNMTEKIESIRASLDKCNAIKLVVDGASDRIKIVLERLREKE